MDPVKASACEAWAAAAGRAAQLWRLQYVCVCVSVLKGPFVLEGLPGTRRNTFALGSLLLIFLMIAGGQVMLSIISGDFRSPFEVSQNLRKKFSGMVPTQTAV